MPPLTGQLGQSADSRMRAARFRLQSLGSRQAKRDPSRTRSRDFIFDSGARDGLVLNQRVIDALPDRGGDRERKRAVLIGRIGRGIFGDGRGQIDQARQDRQANERQYHLIQPRRSDTRCRLCKHLAQRVGASWQDLGWALVEKGNAASSLVEFVQLRPVVVVALQPPSRVGSHQDDGASARSSFTARATP